MGASIVGILAVMVAVVALIAWLMVNLLSGLTTMAIGFAVVCLLMTLIILIQKPRGGGLAGAFGGAGGSTQAAFGAKTGDVLTLATIVFFVCYMALAMGMTWATAPGSAAGAADAPVPADQGDSAPEADTDVPESTGAADTPDDTTTDDAEPTAAPPATPEPGANESADTDAPGTDEP